MAKRRGVWGPWATLSWGAGIFLVCSALQTLVVVGYAGTLEEGLTDGRSVSIAVLLSSLLGTFLVLLAVRAARGTPPAAYLRLAPIRMTSLAPWLAAALGLIVLGHLLSWLLDRPYLPAFDRRLYADAEAKILLWVTLVVAAPVFEEVLFRGFLLEGWRRSRLGGRGAVSLSALLWALVHVQYGPWEQAWILAAGLLLGAARLHTGSLYPPLAMHAAINLVALSELALLSGAGHAGAGGGPAFLLSWFY